VLVSKSFETDLHFYRAVIVLVDKIPPIFAQLGSASHPNTSETPNCVVRMLLSRDAWLRSATTHGRSMARSSAVSRLCPEIENAGNWTVTGTWKSVGRSFVPRGLLHIRRDLSWDSSHYRGQIFAQHQSGQYWLQQFLSQFNLRDGCRILSRMVLGLGKSGIVSQTRTVSFWRGFVPQVRVSDTVPFSRCRSVFQSLRRRNDIVRKFPSFRSKRCVRVSSRSDAPDSAKRCKPS